MEAYRASMARAMPTCSGTWPAKGMPTRLAVATSVSNASLLTPGWILSRSYPAAFCSVTAFAAVAGSGVVVPLNDGPAA